KRQVREKVRVPFSRLSRPGNFAGVFLAERQSHPITDAIRIRTRRSQDPERGVAGNWRAAPLALSIPTLAASVIGAPAVLAMLALRGLDLVRFSPVALFPPRTVRVATLGLDTAARRSQP